MNLKTLAASSVAAAVIIGGVYTFEKDTVPEELKDAKFSQNEDVPIAHFETGQEFEAYLLLLNTKLEEEGNKVKDIKKPEDIVLILNDKLKKEKKGGKTLNGETLAEEEYEALKADLLNKFTK